MQSLEEDRSLLKQYRDSDTVLDPRAGAGAQVERARSNSNSTQSACTGLCMSNIKVSTVSHDDGSLCTEQQLRLHGMPWL